MRHYYVLFAGIILASFIICCSQDAPTDQTTDPTTKTYTGEIAGHQVTIEEPSIGEPVVIIIADDDRYRLYGYRGQSTWTYVLVCEGGNPCREIDIRQAPDEMTTKVWIPMLELARARIWDNTHLNNNG